MLCVCFVVVLDVGSTFKLRCSKRVLKRLLSSICPPSDKAIAFWTRIRSVGRGCLRAVATGFLAPCNQKAKEYKSPAQRRFPQLWQSLPLTRAPIAYCAHEGTLPVFSSDQPELSVSSRAGSHNDDNSAPGQDSQYAISSNDVPTFLYCNNSCSSGVDSNQNSRMSWDGSPLVSKHKKTPADL